MRRSEAVLMANQAGCRALTESPERSVVCVTRCRCHSVSLLRQCLKHLTITRPNDWPPHRLVPPQFNAATSGNHTLTSRSIKIILYRHVDFVFMSKAGHSVLHPVSQHPPLLSHALAIRPEQSCHVPPHLAHRSVQWPPLG